MTPYTMTKNTALGRGHTHPPPHLTLTLNKSLLSHVRDTSYGVFFYHESRDVTPKVSRVTR